MQEKIFAGPFSSSVMAAFASIIMSTFNCYCWTSITMQEKKYKVIGDKSIEV